VLIAVSIILQGVVRLAKHETSGSMSFLFTSGRVTTIDEATVYAMVNSVLPLSERLRTQGRQGESSNESRVRNHLQRIAQVTSESADLRSRSKQMDQQLKALHSALKMLRVVEATGWCCGNRAIIGV
jgi:ribosomal protein L29